MAGFAAPMADHAALRQHMEHMLLRFRDIHGICPDIACNNGAPTWGRHAAHIPFSPGCSRLPAISDIITPPAHHAPSRADYSLSARLATIMMHCTMKMSP